MRVSLARRAAASSIIVVVAMMGAQPALADPPANDTEAGAVAVGALPFTHTQDTSDAAPDGPRFCANSASVFFTFTPEQGGRIQVDTIGSDYDTVLAVYRRDASGHVQPIDCNDDRFGLSSGLRFRASAGATYVFMVGQCCGNGGSGGGELAITVSEVADAELEYTMDVETGSADPATGIATLEGTVTCNERAVVYREGSLRQLRQGLFVARGYWYVEVACAPGETVAWSVEVDTETGIAFGAGSATIRNSYSYATDGFRDYAFAELDDEAITLA